MFGDLFSANESADASTDESRILPEKRDQTGICGIKNQGATCYLNSLLQTLFFTPEFRYRLFALDKEELGFQHYKSSDETQQKIRKIPLQLQLLFARLLHIDQNACDTEQLTKSFGWLDKEHFQQHDVQELSRILFDAINDSLCGTSDQNLVNDLYKGIIKNRIVCASCKHEVVNMEDFLDLTIAVTNNRNISNALKNMFICEELMNGKNQYFCSNCSTLRDATKDSKIKLLPDILTVSLLRFNFDYTTCKRFKENGEFVFPLCLNMAPYVAKQDENDLNEYELYSVIIHKGNAFGGHYHAYIRDFNKMGTVPQNYLFHSKDPQVNDSNSHGNNSALTNPSEIIAYIVAKLGGEDVPLSSISDSLMQECGTSWNKQYRKSYGTMLKYIHSLPELFSVNKKSQTVSLNSFDVLDNDKFQEISMGNVSQDWTDNNAAGDMNDNDDPSNKNLDNSVVWFDFNDSKIHPITMSEMEKQYKGRESAYMLFYRRKKLTEINHSTTKDNCCPDHLKDIIDEENITMDQCRIEKELKKNHINLNVFFSDMFKQANGLVVLKENSIEPLSISFSNDGKVPELKSKIKEIMVEHNFSAANNNAQEISVNELKFLSQNVHIYTSLDLEEDVTIRESSFANNMKVVVWNGKTIADLPITPGAKYEPMVISVECSISNNKNIKVMFHCVVSSHLTMTSIREKLLNFWETAPNGRTENELSASIYNAKEEKTRTVNEAQTSLSVTQLLKESETILLFIDLPTLHENDDESTLDVNIEPDDALMQRICSSFNETSEHISLTQVCASVKICKTIPMATFKENIFQLFDFKRQFVSLSLSASFDNVLLPLCENDLLCNNEANFDKIIVSQNQPLLRNQLCAFVFASRGQNSKIRGNFKLKLGIKCLLDSNISVAKNIKLIVSEMELDKSKLYHLRHVNNDKHSGEVIEITDNLLSKTQVQHGCRLLICEGPAILTGFIQIPVWRYPLYPTLNYCRYENFDLDVPNEMFHENPSFVEYVKINKESTLYDLKENLQLLGEFKNYKLEEIFVRSVYKRLCMKTYISNTLTIKRMKFGPLTPIAIQKRESNDIDTNTIILNVLFHLPCTRHYCLQHELLWKNNQTTATLPETVANLLGTKEITVARYLDDENEWKVLPMTETDIKKHTAKRNRSKKTQNSKNKGRNNSISNRKSYPDLKDGDIIGIKINKRENFDKISKHDFDREEDITARNLKKNSPIEDEPKEVIEKDDKKEASLKIHVDKFE